MRFIFASLKFQQSTSQIIGKQGTDGFPTFVKTELNDSIQEQQKLRSFYDDDDTMDSTQAGQAVVKYEQVRERRRTEYKERNPDDYNSDDSESKFRNWSLKSPDFRVCKSVRFNTGQPSSAELSKSPDFVTSSMAPIQTKIDDDSSSTNSFLEVTDNKMESPEIFSQDFF